MLTFVVAGGGFAGAELAGALNDFARGIVADFPALDPSDIQVVVVHAADRILPELSPSLGSYARERMTARGVRFALGRRVVDIDPRAITLDDGSEIAAQTLIWTAGSVPHPLLRAAGLACSERGAALVTPELETSAKGIWALGDCALVVDAATGAPVPPTAQFALREAPTVAQNIYARVRNARSVAFHHASLGALCVVGYQTACAEIRVPFTRAVLRFSGFFAWVLWRSIYLAKLPGLERQMRVAGDWFAELFFPRDIAQSTQRPLAPDPLSAAR